MGTVHRRGKSARQGINPRGGTAFVPQPVMECERGRNAGLAKKDATDEAGVKWREAGRGRALPSSEFDERPQAAGRHVSVRSSDGRPPDAGAPSVQCPPDPGRRGCLPPIFHILRPRPRGSGFFRTCANASQPGYCAAPEPEDPIVQWPRTPPFHGGNTGSNPVRVACIYEGLRAILELA